MTARTAKNARVILAELAQVESQIARLQAETTLEISKLSVRREELRIALVSAYGEPAAPSVPPSAPLSGSHPAPTLAPVGHNGKGPKRRGPGRPPGSRNKTKKPPAVLPPRAPLGPNRLRAAVGDLRDWCEAEPGRPSYSSAKGWTSSGKTRRAIPERWANYFQKNHGIPLDWWPNGITKGYPKRDAHGDVAPEM